MKFITIINNFVMMNFKTIIKQSKWWAYAAWTLPFVALAILVSEDYFGYGDLVGKTSMIITIVFISISVFWWWWALDKIVFMVNCAKKNEERFEHILTELKDSKKILGDLKDDRNR